MKITTLGTSHGDPTMTRYQTSTLVETRGRCYLIDAGEPANAHLVRRGLSASRLSAVFITHMHIDHTGSLPVLIEQSTKYRHRYPDNHLSVQLPENEAVEPLLGWVRANCGRTKFEDLTVECYRDHGGYDDGFLRMTPFPTRHVPPRADGSPRSHSLLVEAEGKRVLFTGDLSSDFSDFPVSAADGCDAVFAELTHYPLEKAVPVLQTVHPKRLVFYHVHNPYQTPEGEEKVRRLCSILSYPSEIAYDGFVLDLAGATDSIRETCP